MAAENNRDLIEAMIAPRPRRRPAEPTQPSAPSAAASSEPTGEAAQPADEPPAQESASQPAPAPRAARNPAAKVPEVAKSPDLEGRLEVRPIGTSLGLRELATLHRRTWSNLNVQEKRVHMLLWPLALHFGLYQVRAGIERRRPPLIGAFWARCLAEAPLTLGHLYPPQLFKGLMASDVYEFGGMVIDPTYQGKGLVKMMSDTAKLFLFSRRPKLIITNPVVPLYEMYKALGLKAIGREPIEHPHAFNVKVWLMYGKFDELAKPYYM